MTINSDDTVDFHDVDALCATYHAKAPFKPFFRGLYTPDGRDVVDPPPVGHPHHHGLQFGLTLSDVNFWEEDVAHEPDGRPPIGRQLSEGLTTLPEGDGCGFVQQLRWCHEGIDSFVEQRVVTADRGQSDYVWRWQSRLTATREVVIIPSVWPPLGYTGLGIRLARTLFGRGNTAPRDIASGTTPTTVSYLGLGVSITFEQPAGQGDALFISRDEGNDSFAFVSLGPANRHAFTLAAGNTLLRRYVMRVGVR